MFEFNINDKNYENIYFIGIGGISMSGLAKILLKEGYIVAGTDRSKSKVTEDLINHGAKINIGHRASNITRDIDLCIYTDAIKEDNVEILKAKELGIELVDRATFLGALIKNYQNSIAVSGTHGKTSTTSMIASVLSKSSLDPTILLGGQLDDIGGNVRLGNREHLLTEACEYKGNVLKYYPTMAIILNMEEDHLDYFKNLDHIVDTFIGYTKNIQEDGHLIINLDDPNAQRVIEETEAEVISFAIDREADYRADNISFDLNGLPSFDLINQNCLYKVKLNVMGIHNIYNTLATIAACHILGISIEDIIKSLGLYNGTHRRLELKGTINGFTVMDDYAHHPTEIKAALHALKQKKSKVWCIFQPHTYTRTKLLIEEFSNAFFDADNIIITDIYAARENDNGEIHSKDLVNKLVENNMKAVYIENFKEIETYLLDNVKEGDLVVTMGAGDVYLIGEELVEGVEQKVI